MMWTVVLSYRRPPLSLNDRRHWSSRAAAARAVREEVAWLARAQRIPRLTRPTVTLHYAPPDRRRRDVDNLTATAKPCLDGLRDARVIADDDPAHVDHRMPVIAPTEPGGRLWLVIE